MVFLYEHPPWLIEHVTFLRFKCNNNLLFNFYFPLQIGSQWELHSHVHEGLGMVTVWCPVDLWCTNTIDYVASLVSYYNINQACVCVQQPTYCHPFPFHLFIATCNCFRNTIELQFIIEGQHVSREKTCLIYSREVKYQVNNLSRVIVWVRFV